MLGSPLWHPLQVLFGLLLGLGPSTSCSMHSFTQSSSSFRSTCPYQRSLFCCNTNAMSSIPGLSLSSLLGNLSFSLMPHIYLTILISACWSATISSFLTGQVSLPCSMLLRTQLLYNLSLIIWWWFYWYGSQSAGLVTNKVQCKLQKYKNVQLQSQLYPRHNGPNNKV